MASRVIAVLDNGSGKRGTACDDCGTALRYEYHTADGGHYGSCCVHAHIHRPDWMTFKAARDVREFARRRAGFNRMYPICKAQPEIIYNLYNDGSIDIPGIRRYGEAGAEMVIEALQAEGWISSLWSDSIGFHMVTNRYSKRVLRQARALVRE